MGSDYKFIDKAKITKVENLEDIYPGINMVLVRPELDTSVAGKNVQIYIDTFFEEIEYASRIVRILKTPPFLAIKGKKHYDDSFHTALDWCTEMELMPGDLAWVDPLTVVNNNNTSETNAYLCDGQIYFVIRYDKFIVVKRNKQIIPLNGYLLIEKLFEEPEQQVVSANPVCEFSRIAYAGKPNTYYYNSYYSDEIDVVVGDVILNPRYFIALEGSLHRMLDNKRIFYIIQRRHIPINCKNDGFKNISTSPRQIAGKTKYFK